MKHHALRITTAAAFVAGYLLTTSLLAQDKPFRLEDPFPLAQLTAQPTPAATPAPAPTVIIQAPAPAVAVATAKEWIQAVVVILGVITTLLIPAIVNLWTKVAVARAELADVKARQGRQAEKQGQTTAIQASLLAAAPPGTVTVPPPSPSSSAPAILLAFLPLVLFAGCATLTPEQQANRDTRLTAWSVAAAKVVGAVAVNSITSHDREMEGLRK